MTRAPAVQIWPVYVAAILGFCVPKSWGVLGFVFFNAPNSIRTDLFWNAGFSWQGRTRATH